MPSNKGRLYVALYARGGAATMPGGEDTYHWGLMVGPKFEDKNGRSTQYHAKEQMSVAGQSKWFLEERDVPLNADNMLLVRILVGKVENKDRLMSILRKVPIKQGQPQWNCVAWVREGLEALHNDGKALGTNKTNWQLVRDMAMWYVTKKKTEHRFDGAAKFDMTKAATYDLLEGRETIP